MRCEKMYDDKKELTKENWSLKTKLAVMLNNPEDLKAVKASKKAGKKIRKVSS